MTTIDGYDSPIANREDDILHRWPFVREIALLACTAPKGWPVRIGVYGTWGTGKSSVLFLASSLIEEQGHIATFFNPWGYSTPEEMIRALANIALEAVKKSDVKIAGGIRRQVKRAVSRASHALQVGESLAEDADRLLPGARMTAKVAAATRPLLKKYLEGHAKTFTEITQGLGERRLVILIDDVDRADPAVLPALLFAIHQMMAMASLSYVIALDPEIVAAALKEHHPGFGSGSSFLEKIVQFPRWLPEPAADDLLQLALRDAAEYAPFLPEDVIKREATLLPRNPRSLRTTIRNLWTLREEAARHGGDELDWSLAFVLHMLRVDYPALFRFAILHNETIESLVASGLRRAGNRNAPVDVDIPDLVERYVGADELRPRAIQLLERLFGRSIFWLPERISYHALLADRPHAVTWKEYSAFRDAFRSRPEAASIKDWATRHAAIRHESAGHVVEELFIASLTAHDRALGEAADSRTGEQTNQQIALASEAVDIVRTITTTLEPSFEVTAARFEKVLHHFRRWAHFDTDRYRDLRRKERSLLVHLIQLSPIPEELLQILAPWDISGAMDPQKVLLTQTLAETAVPRVAERLASVFTEPSAVEAIVRGDSSAQRHVLFDRQRYWSRERIDVLGKSMDAAPHAVQENCVAFLEALVDEGFQRKWGASPDSVAELLADRDLVIMLWRGATLLAANVRFFSAFARLRERLAERAELDLETPAWWTRIQAELTAASAPTRDADAIDG